MIIIILFLFLLLLFRPASHPPSSHSSYSSHSGHTLLAIFLGIKRLHNQCAFDNGFADCSLSHPSARHSITLCEGLDGVRLQQLFDPMKPIFSPLLNLDGTFGCLC